VRAIVRIVRYKTDTEKHAVSAGFRRGLSTGVCRLSHVQLWHEEVQNMFQREARVRIR